MEFETLEEAIVYANRSAAIIGLVYHVLECTGGFFTATDDAWKMLWSDRIPVYTTK